MEAEEGKTVTRLRIWALLTTLTAATLVRATHLSPGLVPEPFNRSPCILTHPPPLQSISTQKTEGLFKMSVQKKKNKMSVQSDLSSPFRIKIKLLKTASKALCHRAPHCLSNIIPSPLLLVPWPPGSTHLPGTHLPQGLCISYSLCLEFCSPT